MDFFFDVFLFLGWAFVLNIGVVSGIRFVYDSVRLIIIYPSNYLLHFGLHVCFHCFQQKAQYPSLSLHQPNHPGDHF